MIVIGPRPGCAERTRDCLVETEREKLETAVLRLRSTRDSCVETEKH